MSYPKEVVQAFTELVYDSVVVQLFKDWLIEESRKADDKAYHVGGQFNLGYAAGLDFYVKNLYNVNRGVL